MKKKNDDNFHVNQTMLTNMFQSFVSDISRIRDSGRRVLWWRYGLR